MSGHEIFAGVMLTLAALAAVTMTLPVIAALWPLTPRNDR